MPPAGLNTETGLRFAPFIISGDLRPDAAMGLNRSGRPVCAKYQAALLNSIWRPFCVGRAILEHLSHATGKLIPAQWA
jgi:hypothetical protein